MGSLDLRTSYDLDMDRDQDIDATYTGGVFRPDERVPLREGEKVRLTVRSADAGAGERKRAMEFIAKVRREGLVKLGGGRWTRDDLHDRR